MALPSNGPLSLSQIQAVFGGPTPAALSNYYRKAIQTAINSYVFTTAQNVDALVASESGVYPSTFEDGYKYFTSDYGPIFPRDPMAYVGSLGQATIVQVDGQNVSQTQGTLWGQNALVRSWGVATYFKIRAGETYRFRCRMRALNNPTNTEGNPASHIMGLYLLGAEGYGVASCLGQLPHRFKPRMGGPRRYDERDPNLEPLSQCCVGTPLPPRKLLRLHRRRGQLPTGSGRLHGSDIDAGNVRGLRSAAEWRFRRHHGI